MWLSSKDLQRALVSNGMDPIHTHQMLTRKDQQGFLRILYQPKHCQPGLKGTEIGCNEGIMTRREHIQGPGQTGPSWFQRVGPSSRERRPQQAHSQNKAQIHTVITMVQVPISGTIPLFCLLCNAKIKLPHMFYLFLYLFTMGGQMQYHFL